MTQQLANAAHDTEGWVEESMVALDRWGALLNTPSSLWSRPTDAGQQPPHYLGTDRHWTGFAPSPF